jgi:hypothetical protein
MQVQKERRRRRRRRRRRSRQGAVHSLEGRAVSTQTAATLLNRTETWYSSSTPSAHNHVVCTQQRDEKKAEDIKKAHTNKPVLYITYLKQFSVLYKTPLPP